MVYDAGPALIHHDVGCIILYTNTWHSLNAVSMLTHSLRSRPGIKTELGDCTVFSDCYFMRLTLSIPAPETPDPTIHWPNADLMLGHRLRRCATLSQPKPFKL